MRTGFLIPMCWVFPVSSAPSHQSLQISGGESWVDRMGCYAQDSHFSRL